ncbi:hypothetical protein MSHOH_2255 [Methanosarcina horonobensis HB-1 = JCM 15518]|uniref:Uncharacterized protein n=1 Tax=Methanosarcina horonobensis HB-1 = JCM 15518 TaxID=1434110 RepID=A0A0E3SGP1_9EURY|nr:hypothetical protein [Methanosarcina horonobensis]AKB78738.1 hypothetical protein MSHOH_2255 [Methanosarcina horonobensis HB-1 = JCM 15518]
MSRPRFSKDHRTYGGWKKAQPRDSKYAKEIIRKHEYFPDRSLSQLRKARIEDYELSKRAWDSLSDQEKTDRLLSLEVLRGLRKGENLSSVLEKMGLRTEFALKHLGKNLYKSGGTWKVTKTDSIQAEMRIYSTEGLISIVTANSKDRSLLAQYPNRVTRALKNNDPSILDKFKDLKIIDANGKEHRFETDLQALYEIMEAQEEPEFQELYVH